MKHYRDFDLLIGRSGQGYTVRVLDSPAGQASALIPPRLRREIEKLAAEVAALPPTGGDNRRALRLAEELGAKLYGALFHDDVGRRLAASLPRNDQGTEGLRIKLRLAGVPEISRWPWEYLYDKNLGRFLALTATTPIVRYPELAQGERPLAGRLPLSVLAVIASPSDQPRLRTDRELARVKEALEPLIKDHKVVFDHLPSATLSSLATRLRREDFQILHFIGHGAFDAEHGEGMLALEDDRGRTDRVTDDRLSALLLNHPALRLVFLNACEGARHDELDGFGGIAQKLMQLGVPAVIAMQRAISDRAAFTFSTRFYAALAEGTPVDAAVSEGRQAMKLADQGIEWGAPALYLRSPDGILFERCPGAARDSSGSADDKLSIASATSTSPLRLQRMLRERLRHLPRWVWTVAALFLTSGLVLVVWVRALPRWPECPSPGSPEILFVGIQPGTFEMGSAHGEKNERPVHQVTLPQPFCLGAFEVTEGQWNAVMGSAGSEPDSLRPKADVSWDDVQIFLKRLNERVPGRSFRLPTEAEWEYAARAGTATRFSFGNDVGKLYRYGNCRPKWGPGDGYDGVAPVGVLLPNDWQLYDMQGNVWEWVADYDGPYDAAAAVDPHGPLEGTARVRRGGSWNIVSDNCRPTHRASSRHEHSQKDLGFRIAATPVK